MKVEEVVGARLVAAQPSHRVDEVRAMLAEHGIHAVAVVDRTGRALGIVSSLDLGRRLAPSTPISEVMTEHPLEVSLDDDLVAAAERLVEGRVHHLVVTDGGVAVGILSSLDVVRRFVDERRSS